MKQVNQNHLKKSQLVRKTFKVKQDKVAKKIYKIRKNLKKILIKVIIINLKNKTEKKIS